jgi:hypothetical protein
MAPQIEEVVVPAHVLDAQHFLPQTRHRDLHRALRGGSRRRRGVVGLHLGQRLAVHFAACRQRQVVERNECRREHVGGQPLAQEDLPRLGLGARAGGEHDIGDQALIVRAQLAQRHDAVSHAGVLAQHRFDLFELDAEPPQLDLMVHPAEEFERAILPPARQIPGAVQPRARGAGARIGNEPLRGGSAARDACATAVAPM